MNCRTLAVIRSVLFLLALSVTAAAPSDCPAFHGETLHAWHRTWHAPYALHTPLRGYFIPRYPGRCDREDYAGGGGYIGGCGCGMASGTARVWNNSTYTGCATNGCVTSCEPSQFERLGQIPNEVELGISGPPSQPSR